MVNPTHLPLERGLRLVALATSQLALLKALKAPFTPTSAGERRRLALLMEDGRQAPPRLRPRGANSDGCVPLLVGNPDSESLDDDTVPCVPASVARQLQSPEHVRAFVQEFQQSSAAQVGVWGFARGFRGFRGVLVLCGSPGGRGLPRFLHPAVPKPPWQRRWGCVCGTEAYPTVIVLSSAHPGGNSCPLAVFPSSLHSATRSSDLHLLVICNPLLSPPSSPMPLQMQQAEFGAVTQRTAQHVAEVAARQVETVSGELGCPIDWKNLPDVSLWASDDESPPEDGQLAGHFIVCGAEGEWCL